MSRSAVVFTTLALLSLLFYSRYVPAPVTDFVVDDWSSLGNAQAWPSYSALLHSVRDEADRPLCQLAIPTTFRLLGDRPALHAAVGMAYNAIVFLLFLRLAFALTASWPYAISAGVIFALIPNVTTSYHWAHHAAIAYVPAAYLASALAGLAYLQGRRTAWAILAAACYALGLFTYETGLGMPLAFLALADRHRRRRLAALYGLLGAVVVFNLLWRFNIVFGDKHHLVNTRNYLQEGVTPFSLFYALREVVGWWVGGHMLDVLRHGLDGFATLRPWTQRLLFVGNVTAALALASTLWFQVRARTADADRTAPGFRPLVFAALWFAGTQAVSLVSWVAPPLLFLPAMGVALAAAWLFLMLPARSWAPLLAAGAILLLAVNQGTTVCWREAGRFNRNLYSHLRATEPAWRQYDVLYLDTQALRSRLTPDILSPARSDPAVWAWYGNAPLLREFAPATMVYRICAGPPYPAVLIDVEFGGRLEEDVLHWHVRWRPDLPQETPRDRVYVVDVLQAGEDDGSGAAPQADGR